MTKKQFLKTKKGKTLLICGTGPSIEENKEKIKLWTQTYDSIGMDWFCKSKIPTKYYFVRDQAHHSSMLSFDDNETIADFSGLINENYRDSYLLISKLNKSEYDDYGTRWDWGRKSNKLYVRNKIIIPEKRTSTYKDMKEDFLHTCYRYSYDLFCVLQFAHTMGYEHLFLTGFDLNDNKCFWKKGLRNIQRKRGIDLDSESEDWYAYSGMLNYWRNNFHKKIYCLDEDSRLVRHGLGIYLQL